MAKRLCALNTGIDFHLLDHIAPLAEILEMPLITSEEKNFIFSKKYYPNVKAIYNPGIDLSLSKLSLEYDVLFECKYWRPKLKDLFKELYGKEMELVFCPHGQSDKGFSSPLLAPYSYQDSILLYGDLQIEMLKKLRIWPLKRYAITGNYRRLFYQKHKSFYDDLAEREVFSRFKKKQRLLLYAPTWNDSDRSTSFFNHLRWILSEIPTDWNLLIKVHPLLELADPAEYYSLEGLADQKKNILLIGEFPPIYPLLDKADLFLGDYSSVGYDFLTFKRPMLFIPNPRLPQGTLRDVGREINLSVPLKTYLENPIDYSLKQEELLQKAFGKIDSLEWVKNSILSLVLKSREDKHNLEPIEI